MKFSIFLLFYLDLSIFLLDWVIETPKILKASQKHYQKKKKKKEPTKAFITFSPEGIRLLTPVSILFLINELSGPFVTVESLANSPIKFLPKGGDQRVLHNFTSKPTVLSIKEREAFNRLL